MVAGKEGLEEQVPKGLSRPLDKQAGANLATPALAGGQAEVPTDLG